VFIDTIVAPITPPGRGAIAVVRLSGPSAWKIASQLTDDWPEDPSPHRAYFCRVGLDEGLVIPFREGRSFTGEDSVEISIHGSSASINELIDEAIRKGARLAEPGEFTQRAFLNGRMDLTQAEGVRETVDAKTRSQLQMADRLRSGNLSSMVNTIRRAVLAVLAAVEASTDFSEEVGELDRQSASADCRSALDGIETLLASSDTSRIIHDGLVIAIVGRPNAGKSSLLNHLTGIERAIVTDTPGTTRDTLESPIDIGGVPCLLIDTAGLRDSDDPVEQIGIDRARAAAETADLIWLVYDGSTGWTPEDESLLNQFKGPVTVLANKSDLEPSPSPQRGRQISALTGQGLKEITDEIAQIGEKAELQEAALLPRHKPLLEQAAEAMQLTIESLESDMPSDLSAVHLQTALRCLGEITGDTASENILDEVFSQFCVGK
jgi:tRNA modification GTPase